MGSSSNLSNVANPKSPIRNLSISIPLCALLAAVVIIVPFYFSDDTNPNYYIKRDSVSSIDPLSSPNPPKQGVSDNVSVSGRTTCDYSKGEWVPTELEPMYNGTTCETIKRGQNCVVFGRPDTDYLYWRWKPQQCDLPRFDPDTFLKLLRNKHVAFVGDSLARNQLESMLCMMATVSKPNLLYTDGENNRFRKWHFPSHNVNVSIYWSPFLVKGIEKNSETNFNVLFLDKVDERWAGDLEGFDMLVLSSGQWYLLPAIFKYGDKVLGCHVLDQTNCTEVGFYDVFGKALETAFHAILQRKGPNGDAMDVFLTTFPPAHFEGDWDKLGSCSKKRPYKPGQEVLQGMNAEMRRIGIDKVEEAKSRVKEFGQNVRLEALDVTELALLRPDGHPGPYMNPFPFANGVGDRVQNDCVHWCLPGTIDTWNEILLQMIKRRAS